LGKFLNEVGWLTGAVAVHHPMVENWGGEKIYY
jgi:hypothetical protein